MRRLLIALLCSLLLLPMAGLAAPPGADRILIFTRTAKFHHDSIPVAVATLRQLSTEAGLRADHSEDPRDFRADTLARYRAVVFANTTGDVLDATQQAAMEQFIRNGGGFMGVHAAADTEYDWPWYGELVGAWFHKHPEGLQDTLVQPERDGKASGVAWPIRDELYNYRRNPRGMVQVIATVDESRYDGGTMGADHPIAWCRPFDGGRSWYTGLGHDVAVYGDPNVRAQLRRGLRYAAGHAPAC